MLTTAPTHKKFLQSEEGKLFGIGCGMLILWILSIAVLWRAESPYWLRLLTMGFTQILAGRAASIAHATHAGLPPSLITGLAIYIDVMAMLIAYSVLVFSYKNLIEHRFFNHRMKSVFESARQNATRFRKFKIVGIFLFVWFPLWMTGIIAGSILGFLLGLRTWVTMVTVSLGTTSAVICWVYAYDKLFGWLGDIHPAIPLSITLLLILAALVARIFKGLRQNRPAGKAPPGG